MMKKIILLLAIVISLFSAVLAVGSSYVFADGEDVPVDQPIVNVP